MRKEGECGRAPPLSRLKTLLFTRRDFGYLFSMKPNLQFCLTSISSLAVVLATGLAALAAPAGTGPSFKGPIGLQLYSLRAQFDKDVPGTLDEVQRFGIKYAELAGTYKLSPAEFKTQLDARGIEAVSGHFAFERYRDDVDGVIRDAKALGLKYA